MSAVTRDMPGTREAQNIAPGVRDEAPVAALRRVKVGSGSVVFLFAAVSVAPAHPSL